MRRYAPCLLRSGLLVGLSALATQGIRASHSILTLNQLKVTATQRLGFGRLLNDLAPGSRETVSFTASGSALESGVNVISVGGSVQPAGFTLSASESNMVGQNVTIAVGAYAHSASSTHTLPWRLLKADFEGATAQAAQTQGRSLVATLTDVSVPTTGKQLRVFGAVEVEGADASGSYSGTVTVTANHQ